MINWNEPIELVTGQHCYVAKVYSDNSYNIIVPAGFMQYGPGASFVMNKDGTHAFGVYELEVRNVALVFTDKELAAKARESYKAYQDACDALVERGFNIYLDDGNGETEVIDSLGGWHHITRIYKEETAIKEL